MSTRGPYRQSTTRKGKAGGLHPESERSTGPLQPIATCNISTLQACNVTTIHVQRYSNQVATCIINVQRATIRQSARNIWILRDRWSAAADREAICAGNRPTGHGDRCRCIAAPYVRVKCDGQRQRRAGHESTRALAWRRCRPTCNCSGRHATFNKENATCNAMCNALCASLCREETGMPPACGDARTRSFAAWRGCCSVGRIDAAPRHDARKVPPVCHHPNLGRPAVRANVPTHARCHSVRTVS